VCNGYLCFVKPIKGCAKLILATGINLPRVYKHTKKSVDSSGTSCSNIEQLKHTHRMQKCFMQDRVT
jgi:hypothetical protein